MTLSLAIILPSLVTRTSFSKLKSDKIGFFYPVIIAPIVSKGTVEIKSTKNYFFRYSIAVSLPSKISSPVSKSKYVVLNDTKISRQKKMSVKLFKNSIEKEWSIGGLNAISNGISKQL